MRVLHVCAEIYPLLKTGGLADVAGALPPALARQGCDVRILVPGFPALLGGLEDLQPVVSLPTMFGADTIQLHRGKLPGTSTDVYVIEAPQLYGRTGNPYSDANNNAYPDNYLRFALLSWVGAQLTTGLDPAWQAGIVHGHDWHAGLMPAYLKAAEIRTGRRSAGSIFTVHNLAYQGVFPPAIYDELALPAHFFAMHGIEFHGQVSFMKAGLFFSDKLTTVSPTYAREIQRPDQGCGLDGLLKDRTLDLYGILNGVDPEVWNPAIDKTIPARYTLHDIAGKRECKAALQKETGLAVRDDSLLFGVVSRLTEQKGLNLVLAGLPEILRRGGQLVVLGSGDPAMEAEFKEAAAAHPDALSVQIGYDEEKSHRIISGSDVILVPSLFEPCGLTQLYGMIYGTLPLVRKVGGLADSVADCSLENMSDNTATGFVFGEFSVEDFNTAVRRAFALQARKSEWQQVRQNGMGKEFSWDAAAAKYLSVYAPVAPPR